MKFAGSGGGFGVFSALAPVLALPGTPLPGSHPNEPAFTVPTSLWRAFQELSLWVEALCLHEWSLFVERVEQDPAVTRGEVFTLLTATPEARVPLTWFRSQVRLILSEGGQFTCPWTQRRLAAGGFDLDHVIPVSVHPINQLWNLVPSDSRHNLHVKRDRIPGSSSCDGRGPSLRGRMRPTPPLRA